ncbi:MAG TPA: hypothetical protein VJS64_00475 [Pyrinomonadaceae bacterium]|nr:hypothetical protein [Pyrinomonadaceae bacterium]
MITFKKRVPIYLGFLTNFIFVSPILGASDDYFIPKWQTNCKSGNTPFSILFKSKSGYADGDDMEVNVTTGGKHFRVPLPEALYVKMGIVSDSKSICEDIGAFALPEGKVLLWLSSDGRPGWNKLNLVLLSLPEGKVLDIKERIGSIKAPGGQRLAVKGRDGQYEVRLEREWLKNTGTDSAENSIEDWMSIKVMDGKIVNKWSR